uniref:Secreted protein n=1 Tax=uncultured organism TaxID=155900 RepID=M1QA88_9ZZZZ|nr:secreted protein [uncultured organism]
MTNIKRYYIIILLVLIIILSFSCLVNASAEKVYDLLLNNIKKGDLSRSYYWSETLIKDFPDSHELEKTKWLQYPILSAKIEVYNALLEGIYYNKSLSVQNINKALKKCEYPFVESILFRRVNENFLEDFNPDKAYEFFDMVEIPSVPENIEMNQAYYNLTKTDSLEEIRTYEELMERFYLNKWIVVFKKLSNNNKQTRNISLIKLAELLNEAVTVRNKDLKISLDLYKEIKNDPEESETRYRIMDDMLYDLKNLETVIDLLDVALNNTPQYSDQKLDIIEIKEKVMGKHATITEYYNKIMKIYYYEILIIDNKN